MDKPKPASLPQEAMYIVGQDGQPTNAALHEALLAAGDATEDIDYERKRAIERGMSEERARILFQPKK